MPERHRREAVGEDIVGLHQRISGAIQSEVPVAVRVHPVRAQKIRAVLGDLKPTRALFHAVVKHCKRPHLPRLKPDKLIRVEDTTIAVQAGEVATALAVDGVTLPKGNHIIQ